MIFIEMPLHGAYLIGLEKPADACGFLARTWCQQEFEQGGLVSRIVQSNTSLAGGSSDRRPSQDLATEAG